VPGSCEIANGYYCVCFVVTARIYRLLLSIILSFLGNFIVNLFDYKFNLRVSSVYLKLGQHYLMGSNTAPGNDAAVNRTRISYGPTGTKTSMYATYTTVDWAEH
jgi:hypothetical protein